MTSISAYKGAIRSRTEIGKLRLSGTDPFLLTTQIISSTTRPESFSSVRSRLRVKKSWDLRAAMSLSRLWCSQDKPQQARRLLDPIDGWFTEGFETRELKEAKALLGELGA